MRAGTAITVGPSAVPHSDRARSWWIACVLAGLGVIALAAWLLGVIPAATCSGPLPPGLSSLIAFQLARTPADVEHVFGPAGDPCRPGMIAALDAADRVDLLAFIPAYTLFLATALIALARSGAGTVARLGLFALAAAAAFDVVETSVQLYLTGHLPGGPVALTLLAVGSTGKYVMLALVAVCAGLALLGHRTVSARLAATACLVGAALVLFGAVAASARAALGGGNFLAWVAVFLYAIPAAVRGRGTSG